MIIIKLLVGLGKKPELCSGVSAKYSPVINYLLYIHLNYVYTLYLLYIYTFHRRHAAFNRAATIISSENTQLDRNALLIFILWEERYSQFHILAHEIPVPIKV